jgi:hypothetical protein
MRLGALEVPNELTLVSRDIGDSATYLQLGVPSEVLQYAVDNFPVCINRNLLGRVKMDLVLDSTNEAASMRNTSTSARVTELLSSQSAVSAEREQIPRTRVIGVGNVNSIIGGVIVKQRRKEAPQRCRGAFVKLTSDCGVVEGVVLAAPFVQGYTNTTAADPFGFDPAWMITSSLFDPGM